MTIDPISVSGDLIRFPYQPMIVHAVSRISTIAVNELGLPSMGGDPWTI